MTVLTISFSHNWNRKLDCPFFTTIRKWEKEKELFYKKNRGQIFSIVLDGKKYCEAKLVWVKTHQMLAETDDYALVLDAGSQDHRQLFGSFGIGETDAVIHLLFKRIEIDGKQASLPQLP